MGLLDFLFGSKPKPRPRRRVARKRGPDTEARHQQALADRLHRADERRMVREQLAWEQRRHREQRALETAKRRREATTKVLTVRKEKRERSEQGAHARADYRHDQAGQPRPPADERAEQARKLAKLHGGTVEQWEQILARSGTARNPLGLLGYSGRMLEALSFLHMTRHNPGPSRCEVCRLNPTAAEASETFHGSPQYTRGGKTVIGTVEEIVYRVPGGSKRAGSAWSHEAGDRGLGPLFRNRGRATLLGDPNSGAVSIDSRGSGMKYEPERGLVG